jgi:uncharacterized protein YoxC
VESIFEHADVLVTLLTALAALFMGVMGWIITRTLAKIDQNQDKLSDKVDRIATDLAQLTGEHNAIIRGGANVHG